ncbi:hypothetical protein IFM89_031243 [Coptis chinensis]|uniref:non-specific serine/threonine protein kinase n=1 Tax=Coptis chinensis TaxID=261450 RepID=A0A835IRB5_9MAGN|nr:hypothetical protein IFM89_031243 [Coptis chinensis]
MFQLLTFAVVIIGLNGIILVTSDSCSAQFFVEYPFRLNSSDGVMSSDDARFGVTSIDDGYPGLVIKCIDTRRVLNISNHFYHVLEIDYSQKLVRIVDVDILEEPDCPHPRRNVSLQSTPYFHYNTESNVIFFYNCTNNTHTQIVEQPPLPCLDKYNNNTNKRSYAFTGGNLPVGFNRYITCSESVMVPFIYGSDDVYATVNVTKGLKRGFQLGWSTPSECQNCENTGGLCQYNSTGIRGCHCFLGKSMGTFCTGRTGVTFAGKFVIGVSTGVGGVVLLILLVLYRKIIFSSCYWWRSKTESSTNVEVFLENYGCLGLQRYTYSEVKKMTNSFKDTLGKGGYGCVFKGQLRDGRLVAVKVLSESKGNGEDFVNEVATIGRTNHVNVVSLLGFCTERTKRALVYEFMPNGSLERFIYKEKESSFTPLLGSEELYQIALGIARDEEFCPKISDFGMAKLCPTRDVSVVSMVGARGTIGYIAPEVYCRNFGGVSHKSDVYSYGMMVFEMIGGRKNINTKVENMSEIYFPQWVYNHLKPDFNIVGSCEMFEEERTKKMIVVALWCIQSHPTDRPSMTKVVEMLEGNNEDLEMPPNPFLHPPSQSSSSSS